MLRHHTSFEWPSLAMASLLTTLLLGCGATPDEKGDVTSVADGTVDVEAYRGLDVGPTVEVAGVPQVLVPLGVRLDRDEAKRAVDLQLDRVAAAQSYVSREPQSDLTSALAAEVSMRSAMRVRQDPTRRTNLAIFDPRDGTSSLLLDGRGVITRLVHDAPSDAPQMPELPDRMVKFMPAEELVEIARRYEQAAQPSTWPAGLVLIGLINADTSGDGLLTEDDATVAHALTLGDGQLRPLTPAGQDWVGWTRSDDGKRLFLRTTTKPANRKLPGRETEERIYAVVLEDLTVTEVLPETLVDDAVRAAGVRLPQE